MAGGPIVSLCAELGNGMGGAHEDLMEVIGRLESGAVMRMSVNWLTPTKRRRLTSWESAGPWFPTCSPPT